MTRYLVHRTFPNGLHVPMTDRGAEGLTGIVQRNADQDVTWVQSFVTDDKMTTFCIYDAPSPEAIRRAADLEYS